MWERCCGNISKSSELICTGPNLIGPSTDWHQSPICDKVKHQKGCLEVLFFLECMPSTYAAIYKCHPQNKFASVAPRVVLFVALCAQANLPCALWFSGSFSSCNSCYLFSASVYWSMRLELLCNLLAVLNTNCWMKFLRCRQILGTYVAKKWLLILKIFNCWNQFEVLDQQNKK